jgi:glycine dehydrogenase
MLREFVVEEGSFAERHIGSESEAQQEMLKAVGATSLDQFIADVVPSSIRTPDTLALKPFPSALSERDALAKLRAIASQNRVFKSYLGQGYADTITPGVIQRNILENPGWYTQYTPYQPEIAQGRLEALLNFQTLVTELTRLDISNASLLDESTAAAEAMAMSHAIIQREREQDNPTKFFISAHCHPQTIAVVRTRTEALGLSLVVGEDADCTFDKDFFGACFAYPDSTGMVRNLRPQIKRANDMKILVTVVADLFSLLILEAPGVLGADIAVGSTQRFGVPLGFGGPHAAYFATRDQYKRLMPGRLVGVSKDAHGNRGLRLALQTREQHIRREKATSNICTAQVLLANMASMYAVYHGPEGLRRIAESIHSRAARLAALVVEHGIRLASTSFFDTIRLVLSSAECDAIIGRAEARNINVRRLGDGLSITLDETTSDDDLALLVEIITSRSVSAKQIRETRINSYTLSHEFVRGDKYLQQSVFNSYHTETEFLRYLKRLESRDLSLGVSMIPLGSCTMKLNATSEMVPVSWPEFSAIHPAAPANQVEGYKQLFSDLESALASITGFAAVSLQPNAGSQGEYAGLLAIARYHQSRGESAIRRICLIPTSAHGTNPASAVMAGMSVVIVQCDDQGNIDVSDLHKKLEEYGPRVAALMVTYPSTHGVFEEKIKDICAAVHQVGGQVYMDGANLNALVGLIKPGEIGADVCHINLHKTFCIPHGGGGPGMGPIAVAAHLAPFLPGHVIAGAEFSSTEGAVSAAPWGSASILTISWMYMAMMGGEGLTEATKIAILNANYLAERLHHAFPVLYRGGTGRVAHECILDLRPIKKETGIEVEDVAKRLMDYGFHAPTVSFPVAGTIMIEPTESESKAELDRFVDAMLAIRAEIELIRTGAMDKSDNPLKHAPHIATVVTANEWNRSYSRETAAYPLSHLRDFKFWPTVGRIDGGYGDRNLICTCGDAADYESRDV